MPPKGWESRLDELDGLSAAFNLLLPKSIVTSPQCFKIEIDEKISISPKEMLETFNIHLDLNGTIHNALAQLLGRDNVPEIPQFVESLKLAEAIQMMDTQLFAIEIKLYTTGSRSEGLSLPSHFGIDENFCVTSCEESDMDILITLEFMPPKSNSADLASLLLQKLEVLEASHWKIKDTKPGYFKYSGIEYYIVSIISNTIVAIGQEFGEVHGPAVQINAPMRQTDAVLAFKHSKWPKQADEWQTRPRPSGWPSIGLVKEIVHVGCHVVSKSHPMTESAINDEWRYSFSIAEKMLASSLTEVQKQCFLLIKILYYQKLKSSCMGGLTTYHIKTLLLWRAEEISQSEWGSSQLAHHVIGILQQLYECLKERCIPNYFIRNSNLIDNITNKQISTLETILLEILENPLKHILGFWKTNVLFPGPFTTSWGDFASCFEALASSERKDDFMDQVIKLVSWYTQDYPVMQKLASDIVQFHVNFPDIGQTVAMFNCLFKQQMLPLKAALSILRNAMHIACNDREDTVVNIGLSKEIFECLTHIKSEHDITQMSEIEAYEIVMQFFSDKGHVALQIVAQKLQENLKKAEDQNLQCYRQSALPSDRATLAWSVLTRLVAHVFIIMNIQDQSKMQTQITYLSNMVSDLVNMQYPSCLVQCGKQLELHALLKMQNAGGMQTILESLPVSCNVNRLMSRLRDEVIQENSPDDKQAMKLKTGNLDIHPIYRLRNPVFNCRPCVATGKTDQLVKWIEMADKIDINIAQEMTGIQPLGRMNPQQNPPQNFSNLLLFPFDKEQARSFFLPKKNMLRDALQNLAKNRAVVTQGEPGCLHVACRVVITKYLFIVGKCADACEILQDILKDSETCYELYRVYPRVTETLIDAATFSTQENSQFFWNSFFFVHVILYAYYLLVMSYKKLDKVDLSRITAEKMEEFTKYMVEKSIQSQSPWEVIANDLVLLGNAHMMCGNKEHGLSFLGLAALVVMRKGLGGIKKAVEAAFSSTSKTLLEVFSKSLQALQDMADEQEPYASLDILMRVYYPDQSLGDALRNFLLYTHQGHDDDNESLMSLLARTKSWSVAVFLSVIISNMEVTRNL